MWQIDEDGQNGLPVTGRWGTQGESSEPAVVCVRGTL